MDEQSRRLPDPDQDRPLDEVLAEFGRCLRSDGPYGAFDEWSVYDESFRRLVRWAKEVGCFFEGLEPLREGGPEHDLVHDPGSGSWLKFTKSACAGYMVSFDSGLPALEPGLPDEYLNRLRLQNVVFGDSVVFCGVGGSATRPRIITRQADIVGEAATLDQIHELMIEELGFVPLPPRFALGYAGSLAFMRDDVAVFDLRPANVVRTADGLTIPIDSIPVALDEMGRRILSLG